MDGATITADVIAAVAASGAALTYIQARRTSRGRVGTSEADVLWQQSQAMIATLVAQRDRAEAQRDRLIESQATQVLPALASINTGLAHLSDAVARIAEALGRGERGAGGGEGHG